MRTQMRIPGSGVALATLPVALFLTLGTPTPAPAGPGAFRVLAAEKGSPLSASGKISSPLRAVLGAIQERGAAARGAATEGAAAFSSPLVHVNAAGDVQVHVYLSATGPAVIDQLRASGLAVQVVNEQWGIVQGWVPNQRIEEIARLGFVKRLTAPSYAVPRAGRVMTEGDAILKADRLRALGFDGRGVKVGVISDGVDHITSSQASGDVPANVTIVALSGQGDEGTAMLEIVHDLAPGAELAFCGPETNLDMITCVNDLAQQFDADVIVDDLGFPGEPYFEDGPVAQAVAGVVAAGKLYASSAGNQADTHYQGGYTDSGNAFHAHDFGDGDTTMHLQSGSGKSIVVLQWSNRFGHAADDYALCLTDASGRVHFGCSDDPQTGSQDPLEALPLDCQDSHGCTGNIQIEKRSGSAQELEIFLFPGTARPTEHNVPDGSIFGHPCVVGVLATGAIRASDPGNDTIEPFSSRGPCTILFPAEETRLKPDVTGIDGVSVTGAGGFPSPFFGTSAAAPHVAAVGALLMQGFTRNADSVFQALKDSAVDLGASGGDTTFGAGRVDAFAAGQLLDEPPDGAIDSPGASVRVKPGESVSFAGTCNDANSVTGMTVRWTFGQDSGIADSTIEDPGALVFASLGTFEVKLVCTDGFGKSDPTPPTRTITVSQSSDSGGGGCSVPADGAGRARGDLLFVALGLLLVSSFWKIARR